jgi:hypothetical protein
MEARATQTVRQIAGPREQQERPLPAATHTLYQLTDDPGERTDVSAAHPDILQRLTAQLDSLINDGRGRPPSLTSSRPISARGRTPSSAALLARTT